MPPSCSSRRCGPANTLFWVARWPASKVFHQTSLTEHLIMANKAHLQAPTTHQIHWTYMGMSSITLGGHGLVHPCCLGGWLWPCRCHTCIIIIFWHNQTCFAALATSMYMLSTYHSLPLYLHPSIKYAHSKLAHFQEQQPAYTCLHAYLHLSTSLSTPTYTYLHLLYMPLHQLCLP